MKEVKTYEVKKVFSGWKTIIANSEREARDLAQDLILEDLSWREEKIVEVQDNSVY